MGGPESVGRGDVVARNLVHQQVYFAKCGDGKKVMVMEKAERTHQER